MTTGAAHAVIDRLAHTPLRLRVTVAFTLLSVLVTGLLAVLTWNLSTSYMLSQRERSAQRQATVNARLVEIAVQRDPSGLPDLLTGLGSRVESAVLLVDRGKWISSANAVDPGLLPRQLLTMVEAGHAASQRIMLAGTPVLAIGLPIADATATYVEVFPLREIDHTFRFLSWMLGAGVAASGLAGAALGWWAASRALRPLRELTRAAAAAAGDLSVRLPVHRDPDLAPLARAFNDTAARLQARVVRDARFAGDVSHELRSPLTSMLNAMTVLRRREHELSPPAAQAVELLAGDLDRFQRMVSDLLEISLADQGAQLDLELVDLAELVNRTLADYPGGVGVTADVEPPGSRPMVMADRRRIERAVANLVRNAIEHGGGVVRVAVCQQGPRVRILVDDAGPGVPDARKQQVFERFARGGSLRLPPDGHGAGLGLALVAEHTRRHAGSVWVEDRPGGGARFVIELDRAQA